MISKETKKVMFGAGEYYIGDICYVIDDVGDAWEKIGMQIGWGGMESFADWREIFYHNGQDGWMSSTAWGDGSYYDNFGRMYWVDSGSLGILPLSACDLGGFGGNIVKFDKPFEVFCDDGIFFFGNIIINTKGDEEDDYNEF